jgi:pantothenate kinase type III
MRFGLFGKPETRKGGDAKAEAKATAERLKVQVRELLDLPETAAIAVNEILCADPACPGNETVILVMKPGEKTRAYKLQMAMAKVTPEALAEALRS